MTTLTVTARGQVTFRKDVLHHLGVRPGEKIELDKLPDGRVALRAARPPGTIDGFLGLLAVLDDGGDFADGVIAFEGQWLGGEAFRSFDSKAVAALEKRGQAARVLT
jgi:bifunctional DNA-binding transcriptional regulator/antitoxin component of YhaV-PrlF toxin-antitoxin module